MAETNTEVDRFATRAGNQRLESRAPHVLLVEDDDALRALFRDTLEADGFHVTELTDGTTARAYFEACLLDDQPRPIVDCIVTDLRMPGCDGLEVVEVIEDLGRHVPTVMVTAYGDLPTTRRARELGVAAVLDKPVRGTDLTLAVRGALRPSRPRPTTRRRRPLASPPVTHVMVDPIAVDVRFSVLSAVRAMNERGAGSVLVFDGYAFIGIFTERDVLTRVVERGLRAAETRVGQVMTTDPHTIGPHASAAEALRAMRVLRVSHLPVVDRGAPIGVVCRRDIQERRRGRER